MLKQTCDHIKREAYPVAHSMQTLASTAREHPGPLLIKETTGYRKERHLPFLHYVKQQHANIVLSQFPPLYL